MKKLGVVILLCMDLIVGRAQSESVHITRGTKKFEQQSYQEAIECFSKAIDANKNLELAYYKRGNAKRELLDYTGAIADYDKSIEENPQNYRAYYNRGLTYSDLDLNDLAISDYTKSIAIEPDQVSPYVNRGVCLCIENRRDEAMDDFQIALQKDPNQTIALTYQAFIKFELEDFKGSIADCNKVLKINKNSSRALLLRGGAKIGLGKTKSGCRDLERALILGEPLDLETMDEVCP
ncbi:MAG: tetratricopeptide repeat protein [Flavobacteriales bacterium]